MALTPAKIPYIDGAGILSHAGAVWASHPARGGDAVVVQAYGIMNSAQTNAHHTPDANPKDVNLTFLDPTDREKNVNLSTWDSQSLSWSYNITVPVLNGSSSAVTLALPSTAHAVHTVYRIDLGERSVVKLSNA